MRTAWRSAVLWARHWQAPEPPCSALRACRAHGCGMALPGPAARACVFYFAYSFYSDNLPPRSRLFTSCNSRKRAAFLLSAFEKQAPLFVLPGRAKRLLPRASGKAGEAYRGPFCNAGAAFFTRSVHLWAVRQVMQMAAFSAAREGCRYAALPGLV